MTHPEQMPTIMDHSPAWVVHCYLTFGVSMLALIVGIFSLEADLWMRGFLLMGVMFLVSTCFNLSKVVRDQHEAKSWRSRIDAARTKELMDKYDEAG